jgi:hypothetical protein
VLLRVGFVDDDLGMVVLAIAGNFIDSSYRIWCVTAGLMVRLVSPFRPCVRRVLLATVLTSVCACSNAPEARLEPERDTLRLYGGESTPFEIRVVGPTGDSIAKRVTLKVQHSAVVSTKGGWPACRREGTSDVDVEVGSLTTSFVVECRFATRILGETYFELEPDAAPVDVSVTAVFETGDSVRLRAVRGTSTDSSVAVIHGGTVVPRAPGRAGLRIDYGGVRLRAQVVVRRTVFDGTVTLGAGESRGWEVENGRYAISVKVRNKNDLNRLNMETEGLNCSRDLRDEDTIYCVTQDRAQITLLNRGTTFGRAAASAHAQVKILQVP